MVWATDRSRRAVLDAMRARRTYAATDNIVLEFWIGDQFMGGELRAGAGGVPEIRVKAVGTKPFLTAEILRNGQPIHRSAPARADVELRFRDLEPVAGTSYYYARLIQEDGQTAWSSPIWVEVALVVKRTRREVLRDAAVAGIAAGLGRRAGAPSRPPRRNRTSCWSCPTSIATTRSAPPAIRWSRRRRSTGSRAKARMFTRMWCQGPSCRPARASLITARYPYQHGIVGPDAPANDPAWPTVMKRLQSAGYATATFGKTDYGFKDKSGSDVPEGDRGRDGGPESATGRDVREMHPFIRSFGWDYASENPSQLDIALPGYGSSYTDYLRAHGLYDAYCGQVRAHWRGSIDQYAGFVSELEQEHDLASFVAREVIAWLEAPRPRQTVLRRVRAQQAASSLRRRPEVGRLLRRQRRCREGRAVA